MKFLKLLLFFLFIFSFTFAKAQLSVTTKVSEEVQNHSPKKATIMSLALPGLGQIYNKKYWKVPLVYALIATPLYFAIKEQKQFNEYKGAYIKRVDDNPATVDLKYKNAYTNQNMLDLIAMHRKNRDLLFVLTGLAYILNVVDAAVDANLYYFDVSDDLSASIKPNIQYLSSQKMVVPSLTLSLTFSNNKNRSFTKNY